jgi:hypothetical protein
MIYNKEALLYLKEGPQTKITPLVRWHAEKVQEIKDGEFSVPPNVLFLPEDISDTVLKTILKTNRYISALSRVNSIIENPETEKEKKYNKELREKFLIKRDLAQILEEGLHNFCFDKTVVFRGLLIAQGIPATFIHTYSEDDIFNNHRGSHVYSRVFYGGNPENSLIIDTFYSNQSSLLTFKDEIAILPNIIFREGLDSWDIGIHSLSDVHRLKEENLPELIDKYEKAHDIYFKRQCFEKYGNIPSDLSAEKTVEADSYRHRKEMIANKRQELKAA